MATNVNSKSPRTAYASRISDRPSGAHNAPNIAHPGPTALRAAEADRAEVELADDETGTPGTVTFPSSGPDPA
jgi:hypothetical protein